MDDPALEHKIHQQQFMIEQQRQEELMRLQQVALAEKHREERHHHMMMQQHEEERFRGMQQEVAMRHPHDGPPPPHPMQQPPPPHPHPHDAPPHPMQQPPHPHEQPPHPMQQPPPPPHPLEHQMPPPPHPPPPHEHQMVHEMQHLRRPPPTGPPPGPMPPPPPPPHMHPHLHGPPPPIGMMPPGVEDDEDRGGQVGAGGDMDGGPLSGTSPPRPLMSLNVQPPPAMLAALGGPGGGEAADGGIGVPGDQEQAAAVGGGGAQDGGAREVRLPMALEQALAFKTERAKQVGVRPEEIEGGNDKGVMEEPARAQQQLQMPAVPTQKAMDAIYALAGDEDDEEEEEEGGEERRGRGKGEADSGGEDGEKQQRQSKNNRKKRRKKKAKERQRAALEAKKKGEGEAKEAADDADEGKKKKKSTEPDVEVEYIQETLGMSEHDPLFRQFAHIFETFRIADNEKGNEVEADKEAESRPAPPKEMDLKKVPKMDVDDSDDEGNEAEEERKQEGEKSKLSKRKLKRLTRLSVAELKQLVSRPDVVEMHDVTARDPKLLVQLKAHRNTVAVPRHWCFKRKYLQGKRGIEKPPFDLPDFIKRTGIMEMRAALQEKEDQRTLKAKMRERARPKLGKIDIDYQKLHDAFFKWQTKPRMTIHGDLYYEGKEFETRLREKKPGELTEELRTALGMPVGPSAHKVPPPWLIAMQRYGPPPSYPNLKIAGLNAPIPDGCSFGYHAGGWGKPPVDESGRPLYGDVFGTQTQDYSLPVPEEDIDHTLWGELESESEEESEEEEEEEEEEEGVEGGGEGQEDGTGLVTPAEGLITPSGITSIPAGMETPEIIELRKRKIESDMEGGETPALYQVLPEKRLDRLGGAAMMASTHIYDMTGAGGPPPGVPPPPPPGRRLGTGAEAMGVGGPGTVELALDPSELDLVDTEAMAQRYEQTLREQQSQLQKEDLSDMLVEHVARQKNKRKRQQHQENKQAKKYKEFKF